MFVGGCQGGRLVHGYSTLLQLDGNYFFSSNTVLYELNKQRIYFIYLAIKLKIKTLGFKLYTSQFYRFKVDMGELQVTNKLLVVECNSGNSSF